MQYYGILLASCPGIRPRMQGCESVEMYIEIQRQIAKSLVKILT